MLKAAYIIESLRIYSRAFFMIFFYLGGLEFSVFKKHLGNSSEHLNELKYSRETGIIINMPNY